MNPISQEAWSWTLYRDVDALYLSVLCGSVGLYTVDFRLTPEETARFDANGDSFIASLADTVRTSPDLYAQRRLRNFGA